MTAIIADASSLPAAAGPAPSGYLVETIIEGRLAWLVLPVPLQPWTFTFDLEKAHAFEQHHEAKTTRDSIWCGFDSRGYHPSLTVVQFTDEYRARIASEANPPT